MTEFISLTKEKSRLPVRRSPCMGRMPLGYVATDKNVILVGHSLDPFVSCCISKAHSLHPVWLTRFHVWHLFAIRRKLDRKQAILQCLS